MKNIVLLVVFVLGIVFMQFVQAQSVDDIINKYIEARGGKDKLLAITSLYMEGSRQMMGNEVGVKVTIVQDKLYRNDFEFGGKTGYSIITPTEGWNYVPMRSEKVDPIPQDALKNLQTQLDIAGPPLNYKVKGWVPELQGKETIEGKDAYKVKLTSGAGKEVTWYFDTKTYLLVQTRQMGMARGNTPAQEIITNFSDYKSFDGVLFPQTVANPGAGMMGGSTTYDTIIINKAVDESQYKPFK